MSSNQNGRTAKILWAVDPFHEEPEAQLRAFEALTKLFGKAPFTVQPVAMLNLGRYNPVLGYLQFDWKSLADSANEQLTALLSRLEHPGLLRTRLIKQEHATVAGAARDLLALALEEGAEMILVSSHARKGLERALLGSFAECLVLQSPIPVLVVNPTSQAKSVRKIETILFPTDLSDTSYEAFCRTVKLAGSLGLPIRLFHNLQYLSSQVGPSFFYPAVSAESIENLRASIREQAVPWIAFGKKHDVLVSFEMSGGDDRTLDAVLAAAKETGPSTVIAMASQSGRGKALLLGSLTRQVLRSSLSPVLVVHPDHESAVKQFVDEAKLVGYAYTAKPLF